MSTLNSENAPKSRSGWRYLLPLVAILIGVGGTALSWLFPSDQLDRAFRVLGTVVAGGLGTIGLLVWYFFLAGLNWQIRLGTLVLLAVAAGGFAALVRDVKFTGDMIPIFIFVWQPSPDDLLEEQLANQKGKEIEAPQLSAGVSTDYPAYRNRKRDGIISGPALARDWEKNKPVELWKHRCGRGHSSFAVVGNLAITHEQRGDEEVVVAYDTKTGLQRWAHSYEAKFYERAGGVGPRATPTVVEDSVYAYGATGILVCLNVRTGEVKWSVETLEDSQNVSWGSCSSPLVYDKGDGTKLVVVAPGHNGGDNPQDTLAAYNCNNGEKEWGSGEYPAGYSSPMLATLANHPQIIYFDGKGVGGYDSVGGQELWRHEWITQEDINVAQPLVLDGDRVFVSSAYGVGCAMLKIKYQEGNWSVDEPWKNLNLRCKFTSPIHYQGHIYGLNDGLLTCLQAETGERKWEGDFRFGHGQMLLQDGLLLITTEEGKLTLVEANPNEFKPLSIIEVFNERTWNPPSLADGRVYMRCDGRHQWMACYDLRAEKTEEDKD